MYWQGRSVGKISRLFSDWMLVQLEPASGVTKGGIIKPGMYEEPIRTAHVLMAGPGRQYRDRFVPMPEDIIGQRVAFMIAASQTRQGQELRMHLSLPDNGELIRLGDVLLLLPEGVEVHR